LVLKSAYFRNGKDSGNAPQRLGPQCIVVIFLFRPGGRAGRWAEVDWGDRWNFIGTRIKAADIIYVTCVCCGRSSFLKT